MTALYQWFMGFDVKDYNWIKPRPLTDAYKEMCNLYSQLKRFFFEDMYLKKSWESQGGAYSNDPTEEVVMPISDLYSKYEGVCREA